jgi:RNA polymerase sigma-70 factor (ECF subfamily)
MGHLEASDNSVRAPGRTRNETPAFPDGDEGSYGKLKAYLDCRSRGVDPPGPLADAWDRFYRSSTPRIWAFLTRTGLQEADRQDCLQDVWTAAVAHLGNLAYEPRGGQLSTWLMTVARNTAFDSIRYHHRVWVGLDQAKFPLPARDPEPAAEIERRAMQARVRSILLELSERVSALSYRVLYQRGIEGRSCAEVADALRLTPDQVRFRFHRMKRKFRELFERSADALAFEPESERRENEKAKRIPAQH